MSMHIAGSRSPSDRGRGRDGRCGGGVSSPEPHRSGAAVLVPVARGSSGSGGVGIDSDAGAVRRNPRQDGGSSPAWPDASERAAW